MVTLAIGIALSIGIVVGLIAYLKTSISGASGVAVTAIGVEIAAQDARIENLMGGTTNKGSKAQLESVIRETQDLVAGLDSQQKLLKDVELKLDVAQKDVEIKEQTQQESKSSKEEDEIKLQELLASFGDISSESIALEQQLAQSMRNLDTLINEVPMTDDQKAMLTELSEVLVASGSRLRDLITDYQAVNERLEGLKQQHTDLEDEYTKLVEQQLGA